MANKGYSGSTQCFAQGGPVLGKNSAFLKTENEFTSKSHASGKTDENWGKGKGSGSAPAERKSKSLTPVKPRS